MSWTLEFWSGDPRFVTIEDDEKGLRLFEAYKNGADRLAIDTLGLAFPASLVKRLNHDRKGLAGYNYNQSYLVDSHGLAPIGDLIKKQLGDGGKNLQ